MEGVRFRFAAEFTGKYCVDCHSATGNNPKRPKAFPNLNVDTYAGWMEAAGAVPSVLDKTALEAPVMPPSAYRHQPSDSERRVIVDWVVRGSPNTPDGR